MKTYKNLFEKICSFNNILLASRKARRGKRFIESTAKFEISLEKELHKLREELITQTYKPGNYKEFFVEEPKRRMISAAPYRDRVVHHALCNIIEPIFEKTFIFNSYANRKNKGTHRAINKYQQLSRNYKFVLKCDIKKYFPSIDHYLLKKLIQKKIGCDKTLWLIDLIIDNSNKQEEVNEYFIGDDLFTPFERRRGLPIGNLTSQFFANIYLNELDHFVKEKICCKNYIRYVDDFVILMDRKSELLLIKNKLESELDSLRLKLNQNKSIIYRTEDGLKFLGHKVFPNFKLLRRENIVRFKRKLNKMSKKIENGTITENEVKKSVQGWIAHSSFSNSFRLRKKILSAYTFNKG